MRQANVALFWIGMVYGNKRPYDFVSVSDLPYYGTAVLDCAAIARIRILSTAPIISIVDDDQSVRAAMSSLVRSLGYQSRVFRSAEEFLTSPELNDTSCVITDVQMPGMNGMDLQDALSKRRPHMPVILITAFPEERLRKRAETGGAVAFFSKPVDSHALIECLQAALRTG